MIAVGKDPLPYDELAGIIFHFLSVVGMVPFMNKNAGLGETLRESASGFPVLECLQQKPQQVSWMLVFDCAKQSSLSFACSCSESSSALVRVSDIWDYAIRPRIDSFLWISEHEMSVLDHLEMELRFQVQTVKIFTM